MHKRVNILHFDSIFKGFIKGMSNLVISLWLTRFVNILTKSLKLELLHKLRNLLDVLYVKVLICTDIFFVVNKLSSFYLFSRVMQNKKWNS